MSARRGSIVLAVAGLLVLPAAANARSLAGAERSPIAAQPAAQHSAVAANGAADAPASTHATRPAEPTYAEREAASKPLEKFAGGGAGIYIGGSTVAIVLLVILLVVLL